MNHPDVGLRARGELARELAARDFLDPRWGRARAEHCARLCDALASAPGSRPLGLAVAQSAGLAACASEEPWQGAHETWSRTALVLVVRALLSRGPLASGDDGEGSASLAEELALAACALTPRGACPAYKLHALDLAVRSGRKALLEARNLALSTGEHPPGTFGFACADQLSHALSLFLAREANAEALVRDAVLKADAVARRHDAKRWRLAPASERRALVRQALASVAAALVGTIPDAPSTPEAREAALWTARTATRILACLSSVALWFPGAAPRGAPEPSTPCTESAPQAATAPFMTMTTKTELKSELKTESKTESKTSAAPGTPLRGPEATMTTTQTMLQTLKTDATEAAWRTAGSQLVKLARDPLVGLLSRHLAPEDESLRARIAAFLETELGTALLAGLLSVGLASVPASNDVTQRLGRELRIRSMAGTADLMADVLMGPLRQVIALYLQDPSHALTAGAPGTLMEPSLRPSAHVAVTEHETLHR